LFDQLKTEEKVEQLIRAALDREQVQLAYQPVVDLGFELKRRESTARRPS